MAFPRHLLGSVAIQGLGAAATFAAGLAIAFWQGPEAQGHYGLLRTAADLMLALALFGLPQGMVHAINQRGASAASLERLSVRYALALLAAALITCLMLATRTGAPLLPAWPGGAFALMALLVGSIGWVLQGMLRSLALCRGTATLFAWSSVMPSLTLLAGVLLLQIGGSQRYELALAGSGLASAGLTAWQLRALRAQVGWSHGGDVTLRGLLSESGHAFAQTATLALQAWITLHLMRWHGASVAEVGCFVFAAYVFQAFALPTSFVAPVLFAKISAAKGAGRPYETAGILIRAVGLCGAAALGCAVLLPILIPMWFGPAYAPAVQASVLLALAGPLLVVNRLGVSVLFGLGRFRLASLHALLRAVAVPGGLWLVWRFAEADVVTGAAAGWLLTELVGALMLAWFWKGLPSQPGREVDR
jgi:O-antigen/teichoic acid export membrane protein